MPYMNGLEMIEKMKEKGYNMPVIIMSAHTETEYHAKAEKFGVKEYLLKPFDFIKFIDLITNMDIKQVYVNR